MGVALAVGAAMLLTVRGALGPGVRAFGVILASIQVRPGGLLRLTAKLTIMTTSAALLPYPDYRAALPFLVPFLTAIGIQLACTVLIFRSSEPAATPLTPIAETQSHAFLAKLIAALRPIREISAQQERMLASPPTSDEWLAFNLRSTHSDAIAATTALSALAPALGHELSIRRLGARDLKSIFKLVRSLAARSSGFVAFHETFASGLHRSGAEDGPLVVRFAASGPVSRRASFDGDALRLGKTGSRLSDVGEGAAMTPDGLVTTHSRDATSTRVSGASTPTPTRSREHGLLSLLHGRSQAHDGPAHSHSHASIREALYDALKPRARPERVGLYESQRYAALEHRISTDDAAHVCELVALLHTASTPLIEAQTAAIDRVIDLCRVIATSSVLDLLRSPPDEEVARVRRRRANDEVLGALRRAREAYRTRDRLRVVEPFVSLFDTDQLGAGAELSRVSHRGLYWCFLCVSWQIIAPTRAGIRTRCSSPARPPWLFWSA